MEFNAIYKKIGKWYVAWVEEIPGVNTQGRTMKEARDNLREALELILDTNRKLSRKSARKDEYIREPMALPH